MGAGGTFERMARIALNGRLLVPGKLEGIGRFTLRVLEELVAQRPQDQFLLLVDRPVSDMFQLGPNVEIRRLWPPARRPWLMRWWFARPLKRALKSWQADAFVSLEGPIATTMPVDFPQLTVIHDLNFEHNPEWLPSNWARFYRTEFPKYATMARKVASVSEFSRNDLATKYQLDKASIAIIPNAADAWFAPVEEAQIQRARSCWAQGNPYWVYVGSMHPRKNMDGLFAAFGKYVETGGTWDLVVVGEAMWPEEEKSLPDGQLGRVHFAGRLNDDDLVLAIAGASGMTFVPWFEGFGIPILEAMACGVPVIASDVTSLPEVCADAAYALVPPGDAAGIAQSMKDLETDPEGVERVRERGLLRAASFSWNRSGSLLSEALDQLLRQG